MNCIYFDIQLLIQIFIYGAILVAGLVSSVSCALAKSYFGGFCVLYGSSNCTSNDWNNETVCSFDTSDTSVCVYVTMANFLSCVCYPLVCACYLGYLLNKSRYTIQIWTQQQLWLKSLLCGTTLAFLLTFSATCTVTVGLTEWCDTVANAMLDITDGSPCSESQYPSWSWQMTGSAVLLTVGRYYDMFSKTQSAGWLCTAFWVVQLACYVYRMVKSIQLQRRNTYRNAIVSEDTFDSFS